FWTTVAIKKVNDVIRLQALVDKKKVVVTEATIREALCLDDAEGVECLPNEEIFAKLARMGYEKPSTKLTFYKAFFSSQWKFLIHTILQCMSAKRTSWNEFSSSMASAVICLSLGRKFNFSKYIFDSLVRNVDSPTKFYMYPRFLQLMIRKQVGDLSTHTTRYTSTALTQKVFANMRRVGKGFSGVETPLFEGMLVEQQVVEEGDAEVHGKEVNAGDTTEGDVSAAHEEVSTVAEEPSISSPTPPTPPPQPSHDIPSISQAQPTLQQLPQVQTPSPQPQQDARIPMTSPTPPTPPPQPSHDIPSISQAQPTLQQSPQVQTPSPQPQQDARIPMNLLQEVLDTCTDLTRRVEHLQFDKVAQALEITKLKRRVKKLERRNKVRVLKLRRLQKVGTTQRVDSFDKTVMDDVSNQGRMIANMDADVVLEEAKEIFEDAKVDEIPVVTLIVAPARVTAAPNRRRKGVVIRDPEEESTTSTIIPAETKSKDKGKGIILEEPKPLKKHQQIEQDEKYDREYQAMKRKPHTEAQARKNMMLYLKNNVGFKMDYFKGMSYDDIRPIFERYFDSNVAFLQKTKEHTEEEESRALKRLNETLAEKADKRQKLDEERGLGSSMKIARYTCLSLEESKKCTRSNKGQRLEVIGIMWCADHYFYNHSADFVSEEEVPTRKIYSGSDAECLEKSKLDEDKKGKVVDLSRYHDADHAGCQDTRRSTSGSLQFLEDRLISWTMDMKIDEQVALDEALVPHASRLRIWKNNFCLRSDITSNESTLQLATATVHHHLIHFKMNNKKRIVNLEYFREMLHICPRLPNQTFDELSFEEEIQAFLRYLGHSGEIRKLTNVNINKLHQPWRSFATVIDKCLSGKSTGYDSLWLSQAQILWGMYHKKNVDFAYLLWEDFVYQVKHKYAKKRNEMYYPRDDQIFTMIKLVSRHQNTQQFGAMLPVELTNKDIRNSAAYKEYYAIASGATPPKTKASMRKTQSSSDTTRPPPTAATTKRSLQQTYISQASRSGADEGTGIIPGVLDVPTDESDEEISCKSSDEDDDDHDDDDQDDNDDDDQDTDDNFVHPKLSIHEEEAKDEKSFDPIDAEDDNEELYRDVNINLEGQDVQMTDVHTPQKFEYTHVTLTLDLPNFGSLFRFDHRLNTLEVNFEFVQTNQFAGAVSSIPQNVERYMDQRMNEAVKVAVQIQSDRLRDEAQAENEEFLNNLDENIQKFIKEQVKEQFKVQVSKILPKIENTVNEQLEAEVLTRSSNSSKTSYVMATNLSEMELKKILIEKIESNKSIHRSEEQRNLYKALVDAYESNKIILDTYGDTITLRRRRDDAEKDEEPSAGSDRGSKKRREGKEPESTSALKEKAIKTTGKSTQGSKSYQKTASESAPAEEPRQTTQDLEEPSHQEFETGVVDNQPIVEASQHPECDLAKQVDSRSSFCELMDTHVDFSAFLMNRLKVDTLTPELLAVNRESTRDVYSKRRIITITELQIVEWHNYKHLDWIIMRRDDDKLYKFKEGDFKRLRIQDIEDTLLLMVKGKLTNLTVEERFAFNVSLRMFTRSTVIQRRVEDLQLGVESYQKKLNLTKPDTYRFDLKRKEAYTIYSNPRGFIYQNKDKLNRLMRIDELHKFSDGTLNDVRTALDDRLKGIRMKYLPQAIWRKSDRERAASMIQAIDKQLKTRRIMRSMKKFVGGRLYEGDFRMLQRTI
nr:hypothetical protein [Tanacetum cinerariifolium]